VRTDLPLYANPTDLHLRWGTAPANRIPEKTGRIAVHTTGRNIAVAEVEGLGCIVAVAEVMLVPECTVAVAEADSYWTMARPRTVGYCSPRVRPWYLRTSRMAVSTVRRNSAAAADPLDPGRNWTASRPREEPATVPLPYRGDRPRAGPGIRLHYSRRVAPDDAVIPPERR
jgi:hypothetical protein